MRGLFGQAHLGLSVNKVCKDGGTSLIWFSTLIGITVSVILVLSSALHQYFFARNLKNYLEQLTTASLTLWDGKADVSKAVTVIQEQFPTRIEGFRLTYVEILPGPTLKLVGCGTWHSPLPVIELSTELCQVALAR